jgi:hypothetical protein
LTERYVDPDTGAVYELSLTVEEAEQLAQSLGIGKSDTVPENKNE